MKRAIIFYLVFLLVVVNGVFAQKILTFNQGFHSRINSLCLLDSGHIALGGYFDGYKTNQMLVVDTQLTGINDSFSLLFTPGNRSDIYGLHTIDQKLYCLGYNNVCASDNPGNFYRPFYIADRSPIAALQIITVYKAPIAKPLSHFTPLGTKYWAASHDTFLFIFEREGKISGEPVRLNQNISEIAAIDSQYLAVAVEKRLLKISFSGNQSNSHTFSSRITGIATIANSEGLFVVSTTTGMYVMNNDFQVLINFNWDKLKDDISTTIGLQSVGEKLYLLGLGVDSTIQLATLTTSLNVVNIEQVYQSIETINDWLVTGKNLYLAIKQDAQDLLGQPIPEQQDFLVKHRLRSSSVSLLPDLEIKSAAFDSIILTKAANFPVLKKVNADSYLRIQVHNKGNIRINTFSVSLQGSFIPLKKCDPLSTIYSFEKSIKPGATLNLSLPSFSDRQLPDASEYKIQINLFNVNGLPDEYPLDNNFLASAKLETLPAELPEVALFQIYPQPVSLYGFNLHCVNALHYSILDLQGRIVLQGFSEAGHQWISYHLVPGVYVFEAKTDYGLYRQKLIVN